MVVLLLICLIAGIGIGHTILDDEIPLASGTSAVFYINDSNKPSESVSYLFCKKVGNGTISFKESKIYNAAGVDNYIVKAPDVSAYISEGQAVRWVRIYKSFYTYCVIGEIYTPVNNSGNVGGSQNGVNSNGANSGNSGNTGNVGTGTGTGTASVNNFAHTNGTDIYIGNDKYVIKGVVASNAVASLPSTYDVDMMTEADYKEISELGFNTVRFLFNYNILEDDNNPYVYKQSGWDWFDMNIEWAKKYGIHLILDCHLSPGGVPSTGGNQSVWVPGEEKQERLVAMWNAIAARYKDNDTILAYGLLNEPFVDNGDSNAWNNLISRMVKAIRSSDKNHMLMIQRAQIGDNKKYLYPSVSDNNWVLEVHKYPNVDMKLVERYFVIPDDYFYYGNTSIVGYRNADKSTESNTSSASLGNNAGLSNEWKAYSFDFVAKDSNNAYLLLEVSNLGENQKVEVSDLSVVCEGKEIYNMTHNLDDKYTSWAKDDLGSINYSAFNNLISVTGKATYLSLADNSVFRYFGVEQGKTYTVSLKVRTQTGIADKTVLKVTAKEYKTSDICLLNKDYTAKIMDCSDIQKNYNVPIYYGEVGIPRNLYGGNRKMEDLSYDILNYLNQNSCNYTWFTWHEPNFGIYTSSGLEPKSNPNEVLREQVKLIINQK